MVVRKDIKDNEFNPYYAQYIDQVPEGLTLIDSLSMGHTFTQDFFSNLTLEQQETRYEEGKWTPKEVLLHLIDTERIFSYRALRFGRMDSSPLVGFDQDHFVLHSAAGNKSIEDFVSEYSNVRQATLSLFKSMGDLSLAWTGEASGSMLSPRAAAFIIAGHERHHIRIIKERYL